MVAALVVHIRGLRYLSSVGSGVGLLDHRSGHPIRRLENKKVVNVAAYRSSLVHPSAAPDQSEQRS